MPWGLRAGTSAPYPYATGPTTDNASLVVESPVGTVQFSFDSVLGCPIQGVGTAIIVPVTSGTITPISPTTLVQPAGAITAVVLAVGTKQGQTIEIVNLSAFAITFDVVANSHVADGVSAVIPALRKMSFQWNTNIGAWVRSG